MSLQEIEKAISGLSAGDLDEFSRWFEEFRADAWDRQIEADANAGRLDSALQKADDDFDAGRCTPL
jgi:hypothetical protein